MSFEELNRDDLLDLELISGIPIISVYEQISNFLNTEAQQIRAFFEGRVDFVVAQQFRQLDKMLDLTVRTIDNLTNNKYRFDLYKNWIVIENLEDSLLSLQTLKNYSIWSRSNRNINIYAGNVEVSYIQKQEQTLEQIEVESGSLDSDTTWYESAIRNMLKEEDYTNEGGVPLKIIFKNAPTAFLESVVSAVDNGLKSFGLDIKKKIEFSGDDLVTLDNKETLIQSADILLNLRKGDNPSVPNLGIDQVSILGSNKGSFLFPVIFRQIIELFATDDTFSSVEVGKISFNQDAIFIDVTISSRYRETIEGLVQL